MKPHLRSGPFLALLFVAGCTRSAETSRRATLPFTGCDRVLLSAGAELRCELPPGGKLTVGLDGPVRELGPPEIDSELRGDVLVVSSLGRLFIGTETGALRMQLSTSSSSVAHPGFAAARRRLRRGEPKDAARLATELAQETDDLRLRIRAHLLAAYAYTVILQDLELARGSIEAARAVPLAEAIDGGAALDIGHAQLELQTGHHVDALERLGGAAEVASRLGLDKLAIVAETNRADVLLELGRFAAAAEIYAPSTTKGSTCARARSGLNEGWARYLEAIRGAGQLQPAERVMGEAARLFAEGCEDRLGAAANRLNLALVAMARGDHAAAERDLARSRSILPERPPWLELWDLDLDGRLALTSKRLDRAEDRFGRLFEVSTEDVDAQVRALLGLAEVEARRERPERGLEALVRAEQTIVSAARRLPAMTERASFLGGYELALDRMAELGRLAGRPDVVARASSRTRAHVIRALAWPWILERLETGAQRKFETALQEFRRHREDAKGPSWDAPQDARRQALETQAQAARAARSAALRAFESLGDGEAPVATSTRATLHGFRGGKSWLLERGDGTASFDASPSCLVETTAPGSVIRLLGPRLDTALFSELIERRPLARAVGVAARSSNSSTSTSTERALVVADPAGDLPEARREGRDVAERLSASGWQVHLLEGSSAQRSAVLEQLPQVQLFHFAGHGRLTPNDPMQTGLRLADGSLISPTDVLSLGAGPRFVVLSGCETGRPRDRGPAELGLAEAFVILGAKLVIGAAEEVPDASARRFTRLLYRHGAPRTPSRAWRAQRELRAEGLEDWAMFRTFIP